MRNVKARTIGSLFLLSLAVIAAYIGGIYQGRTGSEISLTKKAQAAGGTVTGPNTVAPDRYVYYPGTEELAKDEIRVIACGTGLPAARRSQAATCFLIEAGNGDKFLFDVGTGSMGNIASLMIPY